MSFLAGIAAALVVTAGGVWLVTTRAERAIYHAMRTGEGMMGRRVVADGIASVVVVAIAILAFKLVPRALPSDGRDDEAARLRTEQLQRELTEDGWRVALGQNVGHLTQKLQQERSKGDSAQQAHQRAVAAIAQDLKAAEAELEAVIEFQAVGESQLEASAIAHGTAAVPDSFVAEFDDGLLRGRGTLTPAPSPLLRLAYVVEAPGTIVIARAPDREQLLVAARSSDPRVRFNIPAVEYQMPAPIERCSLGTRIKWGLGGAALGAGAAAFAPRYRP